MTVLLKIKENEKNISAKPGGFINVHQNCLTVLLPQCEMTKDKKKRKKKKLALTNPNPKAETSVGILLRSDVQNEALGMINVIESPNDFHLSLSIASPVT